MLEVVDKLRERILHGDVASIALMIELEGEQRPVLALRGRWKSDPHRCAVAVQHAWAKVNKQIMASDSTPGFG